MSLTSRYMLPRMPQGLKGLVELALDMRWSWSHRADALWRRLDPELWQSTGNPWLILIRIGDRRLQRLAADPDFLGEIEEQLTAYRTAMAAPTWFAEQGLSGRLRQVAYFSMEFGITETLPIYSGGLGMLAGDTLKTASDLGLPLVGVGLLYQQGYFRQVLDAEGQQVALYPFNDPIELPVMPLRDADGEWLRVEIALPGRPLHLQLWQAKVGRVRLLLLDSNDPLNSPADRGVTGELYGGDLLTRLQQELVLGIGGWRALRAAGYDPEVCHLNEGHAAFVVLERARDRMVEDRLSLEEAISTSRAGNLFTTHTPVAAGFDRFPADLIRQQLGPYATQLGVSIEHLLALAADNPGGPGAAFNMARLAVRGSLAVNAVSGLHEQVSRRLFAPWFPRWPLAEIPVCHVTNGVHIPSWDSAEADHFWTRMCGKERWRGDLAALPEVIGGVEDEALWRLRKQGRQQLVNFVRGRLVAQHAALAGSASRLRQAAEVLDPDALTLCFARRFATYKRPNLLLQDRRRLAALLRNPQRPVQLVIAGKAHPRDLPGQAMIQDWIGFIREFDLHHRVVFLNDYDMLVAGQLVQGADLWVNTPRRPWEACGTSGMKVLVNGGLNLSELDGWWAEAWRPELGWAIGDGREHDQDPAWDAAEACQLYDLLEREVVPEFYRHDARGIPAAWVARIRRSMAELAPRFSTNRMLREYLDRHYLPLAAAYRRRRIDASRLGREIEVWRQRLVRHWPALHWDEVQVRREGGGYRVRLQVYLNGLEAEDLAVECYADAVDDWPTHCQRLRCGDALPGAVNGFAYETVLPGDRPLAHYTLRLVPDHPEADVPLDLPLITWLDQTLEKFTDE